MQLAFTIGTISFSKLIFGLAGSFVWADVTKGNSPTTAATETETYGTKVFTKFTNDIFA